MIALITGASSGLGAEFSRQLDREKLDELWLIARDEEKLHSMAETLTTPCRIISCDLASVSAIEKRIVTLLETEQPDVQFCVNNAGFGKIGPFDQLKEIDMTSMVDVNCRAVVHLSHAVLPYMKRGSALIHTSSAASFMPLGGFAVYAASKAFVTSFSIAIQAELRERGIYSIAVCPGPVETDFSRRAHIGSVRSDSVLKKKADATPIIAKALSDVRRKRSLSVFGIPFQLMALFSRFLPSYWLARISYLRIMKK